jgi:hypothetical protein
MARRSVWLVTGVVAGAASSLYAERKLRRTVEAASARLQPDALAAEVGRSARQAVTSTGDRLREAVASGREEKRRREGELWAELHRDGAEPVPSGGGEERYRAVTGYDVPTAATPAGAVAPTPSAHGANRRARRAARRSPTHLGK